MDTFSLVCWAILEIEAQICSPPMTAEKAQGLFDGAAKYETRMYIKPVEAQPVDIVEAPPSADAPPKRFVKATSLAKPPVETASQTRPKTKSSAMTQQEKESLFREFQQGRVMTEEEKKAMFQQFKSWQQDQTR
jgi:hypothetical protein